MTHSCSVLLTKETTLFDINGSTDLESAKAAICGVALDGETFLASMTSCRVELPQLAHYLRYASQVTRFNNIKSMFFSSQHHLLRTGNMMLPKLLPF